MIIAFPIIILLITTSLLVAKPVLYSNPVIPSPSNCNAPPYPSDCETPDPGVIWLEDYKIWLVVTTTADGNGVFRMHTSSDLVNWESKGFIWPNISSEGRPSWGIGSWFAPEIHRVYTSSTACMCIFIPILSD